MRKPLIALFLFAAVGLGAWRFLAPATVSKNPMERMKTASPMETVRIAKPVAPAPAPVVRSAPAAPIQMTAQRAKMEERFSDLKEEGRRVRETLLASDPKAAQAYNEVVRRPEYRARLDRRHQIEAAWAAAPEKDRDGMLTEMNSLRQQGFTLILGEIQRLQSQPAAPTANGATTSAPAAAPAPAPAAPIVFQ
jgi:type II secretory pathway component PulJ